VGKAELAIVANGFGMQRSMMTETHGEAWDGISNSSSVL
jgi:hypothetical protein